jgi:hypothetical protein
MILASELGDLAPDYATSATAGTYIDLAWRPRDPGQEDTVSWLIGRAHETGVVSQPDGAQVTIGYVDDGNDWCYQFFLTVNAPLLLTLAAQPREMSLLGGDTVSSGVNAAITVLQEAVEVGNVLVSQLTDFISAATRKS